MLWLKSITKSIEHPESNMKMHVIYKYDDRLLAIFAALKLYALQG